jgi:hypothetical protein
MTLPGLYRLASLWVGPYADTVASSAAGPESHLRDALSTPHTPPHPVLLFVPSGHYMRSRTTEAGTNMAHDVTTYTSPPTALVTLLKKHVPHSLPLLRRLQFTRFPGGITEHTKILWSSQSALADADPAGTPFTAGYLDFSRGPETELWLYTSLEHRQPTSTSTRTVDEEAACGDQAVLVMQEVKRVRDAYSEERKASPEILLGTLSEVTRQLLANRAVVFPYVSIYDKWLFRLDELPTVQSPLAEGMRWSRVRREDIPLVLSRTDIPRKEYVRHPTSQGNREQRDPDELTEGRSNCYLVFRWSSRITPRLHGVSWDLTHL